jgi:hypothetical protein
MCVFPITAFFLQALSNKIIHKFLTIAANIRKFASRETFLPGRSRGQIIPPPPDFRAGPKELPNLYGIVKCQKIKKAARAGRPSD